MGSENQSLPIYSAKLAIYENRGKGTMRNIIIHIHKRTAKNITSKSRVEIVVKKISVGLFSF